MDLLVVNGFDLCFLFVPGPIPAALGMLRNLQELRLVQNKLSGNYSILFVLDLLGC
jgi:hypothetical protein